MVVDGFSPPDLGSHYIVLVDGVLWSQADEE